MKKKADKSLEEAGALAQEIHDKYQPAFEAVGNNIAHGYGKDPKTGESTIELRLTSDKLKNTLPAEYKGVKVNIRVTGVIKALLE